MSRDVIVQFWLSNEKKISRQLSGMPVNHCQSPPPYLHMATSEMWCWFGGRGILTVLCTIIMVQAVNYRSLAGSGFDLALFSFYILSTSIFVFIVLCLWIYIYNFLSDKYNASVCWIYRLLYFFLFEDRYLGKGATDWREILQDDTYTSPTCLLPFGDGTPRRSLKSKILVL